MSTYLVAFVVSDFENRTSDASLSTPTFRVWARKDAIEQAEYARDIGPRILSHYEKYFNVDFPLPKQDMIALPDFGAG
jgi:aminopeptidase N